MWHSGVVAWAGDVRAWESAGTMATWSRGMVVLGLDGVGCGGMVE